MRQLNNLAKRLLHDRRGATAVEYGLILALVFLAIVGGIAGVADATTDLWGEVNSEVDQVMR